MNPKPWIAAMQARIKVKRDLRKFTHRRKFIMQQVFFITHEVHFTTPGQKKIKRALQITAQVWTIIVHPHFYRNYR